jgi:peptidoglycan hydrolase CwlO-like protein
MNLRILFVVLATMAGAALAADGETAPKVVTISLNEDVISLVKGAIWVGGFFLTIFALIGITFFGWDVRNARSLIVKAQKEIQESLEAMRKDATALKELKEQLEQTGAQVQEDIEKIQPPPALVQGARSNIDLIREVIKTSNYTWTTVGRLLKRTGLDRETVLREIRAAPDIEIAFGKETQDQIFRFKEPS